MDSISVQNLKDAKVDAGDLAEFTNGEDNQTVTSRLGKQYPSIPKLVKDFNTDATNRLNANDATALSHLNANDAAASDQRAAIQAAGNVVLAGLSYGVPVAYTSGLSMTLPTQTVQYNGQTYAPKLGDLPFTTSGTFETAKFRLIQGIAAPDLALGTGASLVGINQEVTGSVLRTVKSVGSDFISARAFGVIGDGTTLDDAAVLKAITETAATGRPVYWHDMQVRISQSVGLTISKDFYWRGDGAQFINYSATQLEYLIRLAAIKKEICFEGIGFNGRSLTNKLLDVLGTGVTTMDDANKLYIKGGTFENVRRIATVSHGDAIRVQGGFSLVDISGVKVRNVTMAAGAGTAGIVGVTGITIFGNDPNAYPSRMVVRDSSIENIKSEDLAYIFDQDGVRLFGPHTATLGQYVPNEVIVTNCDFLNCYGRSIKSQSFVNHVSTSRFRRTAGLTAGAGNGEIAFQIGGGDVERCTFDYKNGQQPGSCVSYGFLPNYTDTSGQVSSCKVFLDTSTTLHSFLTTDTSGGGKAGKVTLKACSIYGKIERFVDYTINGNTNNSLTVCDNDISDIVDVTAGTTPVTAKSLIFVTANGGTSPYTANVLAYNNSYKNTTNTPYLLRDTITGNSAQTKLSQFGNTGFINDKQITPNSNGLKGDKIFRVGAIGPDVDDTPISNNNFTTGSYSIQTVFVAAGATMTMKLRNASGAKVDMVVNTNVLGYATFVSQTTTNTVISKGADFEVGNNSEPATGSSFRVWSSASNELSIKNLTATGRSFTAGILSPG